MDIEERADMKFKRCFSACPVVFMMIVLTAPLRGSLHFVAMWNASAIRTGDPGKEDCGDRVERR